MYVPPYIVQALYEDRVRDAQNSARNRLLRDISEGAPNEYSDGLISRVKQWLAHRDQPQRQETADVRRAHAL